MNDKTLRSKLIRLAHANPAVRKDLLPLLTKQAAEGLSLKKQYEEVERAYAKTVFAELTKRFQDMGQTVFRPIAPHARWEIRRRHSFADVFVLVEQDGYRDRLTYSLRVTRDEGRPLVDKDIYDWIMVSPEQMAEEIAAKVQAVCLKADI